PCWGQCGAWPGQDRPPSPGRRRRRRGGVTACPVGGGGGFRLHINCIGTGSPTVVIEAGWGDSSAAWSSWVQPSAASTTRVCTYDRAGMGYSDPGPLPRTAERFAAELHALLSSASEPGPYVLVGHSMGGLTVRVFAHA